jgi:hypothetical protein
MGRKTSNMIPFVVATVMILAAATMLRKRRAEGFQWAEGASGCKWDSKLGYNDPSCYGRDPTSDRLEEARRRGVQWTDGYPLVCLGFDTPWVQWTGPMKNGLPLICFDRTIKGNVAIPVPNVPYVSKYYEPGRSRAVGWEPSAEQPLDTIYFIDSKTLSTTTAPSGGTAAPAPAPSTAPTAAATTSQSTTNGGKEFIKIDSNNIYTTKVVLLLVAWILAMLLFIDITILPNDILHGASKSPNPFGWFLLLTTLALGVTGIFV